MYAYWKTKSSENNCLTVPSDRRYNNNKFFSEKKTCIPVHQYGAALTRL